MRVRAPQRAHKEGRVAQVPVGRLVADQRVGRQAVRGPLAQVAVCRRDGRHRKALLVLLQQQPRHLRRARSTVLWCSYPADMRPLVRSSARISGTAEAAWELSAASGIYKTGKRYSKQVRSKYEGDLQECD